MIYLFLTDIGIEPHTIKEYGKGEFLGELTEQEWEQCDQLARMIDGELFLGKTQPEKDDEQAREVRSTRDRLLADTDWTQTVDNPFAGDNDVTAYRQALRDIPEQEGFPWNVEWPVYNKE